MALPLTLRYGITAELHKSLDADIIKRVDASARVSNLVVTKTGGLRPCLYLRQVSKAVIPDKYPLPTLEELQPSFMAQQFFLSLTSDWATCRFLFTLKGTSPLS